MQGDRARALEQVPLFASLPPEEVQHLAGALRPLRVPAGALLFREGEHGATFYIVLEGQVEVVKAHGTADEQLLGVRGPGEFVGEMSLLNRDDVRMASVYAREPATLLELTRAEFDALLTRRPFLAYEMVKVLSARLRSAHDDAIRDMRKKNTLLRDAYEALRDAQAQIIEKEKLERELEVAHDIQMSLLPHTLPDFAPFDFGARIAPARAVGGDLFDFIPLDDETMAVVIGDVSDKGVPAAIFMAQVHALLRAEASAAASPRATLHAVNLHLLDMNARGLFVTVLYGVLKQRTGEFAYARAGHELPMLCSVAGEVTEVGRGRGQPLGLFDAPLLDEQTITLTPGSMLLLYTDGVTDPNDHSGLAFDVDQLKAALCACASMAAQGACDHLMQAVTAYHQNAPQHDDITLVAVRAGAAP